MLGVPQTGLSPAPKNLYLSQNPPLEDNFSMLTSVFILFFFVQIFVVVLFGFVDGDMDGDLGPMDPLLVIFGTIC